MSLSRGRWYKWAYLFALAVGLLAAYFMQLAEANDYMGYRVFPVDIAYLATAAASIFAAGVLIPTHAQRPSDFFALLYGLFVVLPYATLFPIRGPVEPGQFTLYFAALIFPIVAIRLTTVVVPAVRVPALFNHRALVWLAAVVCVFGLFLALANPPTSAGFDLASSYDRRIEGRSVFPAGAPAAYLNAAIVNGFAPFLAFMAGWRRQILPFAVSVCSGVGFFYLLGLKAPLFFILLALIIGHAARRDRLSAVFRTIYFLIFGAFTLFLIERVLLGFSLIGDYFIRRVFTIPPYVMSAYLDFMASTSNIRWSPAEGVMASGPISFLVGESFLATPGLNANTNTFIYQLASGGIPMYFLTVLLIAAVFGALDAAYKCKRNPVLMYLGFSYAILLTEQAAATALVSSGLGVLILLNIFSGSKNRVFLIRARLARHEGFHRRYAGT